MLHLRALNLNCVMLQLQLHAPLVLRFSLPPHRRGWLLVPEYRADAVLATVAASITVVSVTIADPQQANT